MSCSKLLLLERKLQRQNYSATMKTATIKTTDSRRIEEEQSFKHRSNRSPFPRPFNLVKSNAEMMALAFERWQISRRQFATPRGLAELRAARSRSSSAFRGLLVSLRASSWKIQAGGKDPGPGLFIISAAHSEDRVSVDARWSRAVRCVPLAFLWDASSARRAR